MNNKKLNSISKVKNCLIRKWKRTAKRKGFKLNNKNIKRLLDSSYTYNLICKKFNKPKDNINTLLWYVYSDKIVDVITQEPVLLNVLSMSRSSIFNKGTPIT